MSNTSELQALLANIESKRSLLEDLKDELRFLWEADEFDFEDSIWKLEDALALIEQAIDLHE